LKEGRKGRKEGRKKEGGGVHLRQNLTCREASICPCTLKDESTAGRKNEREEGREDRRGERTEGMKEGRKEGRKEETKKQGNEETKERR
jgi:hypothetical protein